MANSFPEFKILRPKQDSSMLAKHVGFFDRNNDGIIYPRETFQGLKAIGCNVLIALVGAIGINIGLSWMTRKGKLPSLRFPIVIKNIAATKHGSDTGVYDENGEFIQEKFDEIFNTYARRDPNGLNFIEIQVMLHKNRKPGDIFGGLAAFLEWTFLYIIANKKGLLQKDTIRGVYDGTLFQQMECEHKNKNKDDDNNNPKHK